MITSQENYKVVLDRIEEIFDAEPNTREFTELKKLVAWVEAYEDIHYPFGKGEEK